MLLNGRNNKIDISKYQPIKDSSLSTIDKTVSGSIKELDSQIKKMVKKTKFVDNKLFLLQEDGTEIDSGTELIINNNKINNSIDISDLDVKYNLATDENTKLVQNAFNYCNENKIKLIISNKLLITTSLELPQFLHLEGTFNGAIILKSDIPTYLFGKENNDESSEYDPSSNTSYFEGEINNIIFHTNENLSWGYNSKHSLFYKIGIRTKIKNCVIRAWNRVFDECGFYWAGELLNNRILSISDSTFYNCFISDFYMNDNYFNGGQPVDSNNKGYQPSLFNKGYGGMLTFKGNWVEFYKDFIPPTMYTDIVNNLFDYCQKGGVSYYTNVNNNIFTHCSVSDITYNFSLFNITDLVDELKNKSYTLKIRIGCNICNNTIECDKLYKDNNTSFILISGDEAGNSSDLNIINNVTYNLAGHNTINYMKKFIDYDDTIHFKNTTLKNININLFENIEISDTDLKDVKYNVKFKKNNEVLTPINYFNYDEYPYSILLDKNGNYYNFKTKNITPVFNQSNWNGAINDNWNIKNERRIIHTPKQTGWDFITSKFELNTNYKVIRVNSYNNQIRIEFLDTSSEILKYHYISTETLLTIPDNTKYINVYLRRNVLQDDIDNNYILEYDLPIINYYSNEPYGKIDFDRIVYLDDEYNRVEERY